MIDQASAYPAGQLVPGYADPMVGQARHLLQTERSTSIQHISSEQNFHDALVRDLTEARQYIIIMSPFMTHHRLQTYLGLLRAKVR